MKFRISIVVLAVCAAIGPGCRRDPVAAGREFARRGDDYVAQKKAPEAIIEYRKSIAANPRDGGTRLKLARLYADANDVQHALPEYVRAADLLPDDVSAQLTAGRVLLSVGQFDDARGRADKVLKLQPKNVDAQILKGNALAGLKDIDGAIAQVEQAISNDPSASVAYSNLGALQFAKGDPAAAELALRKATATDPKSVPARLALANFYWATNRKDKAEEALKATLALEPRNLLANRALALFYIGAGRAREAEQPLKTIAGAAPGFEGRLQLADYYAAQQRPAEAKALLEQIEQQPGGLIPAKLRLAAMGFFSGDHAAAYKLIEEVLQKDPKQLDALVGKARLQAADGKLDDALATARRAVAANASSPQAHYMLGTILEARNQHDEAETSFKEAVRLNQRFGPAYVQLAKLSLAAGKADDALQLARSGVENGASDGEARLVLARAQLVSHDLAGAEQTLKSFQSAAGLPIVQNELGRLYLAKGDRTAARAAFENALRKEPTSSDALGGLLSLDVAERQLGPARARIEAAESAAPRNAALKVIAARTYAAAGDLPAAERTLKQAIEVDPNSLQAYDSLARVYAMQQRLPEASAEFDKLAQRQPKAIGPRVLAGVLLQLQNKPDEAKIRYQKALEIDPRAGVAANNLAWLYAERNENLDVALQLAQTAKAQLPKQHEVDDTLGWVYYKKGLSTLAIASFKQCAASQPDNPMYAYHLGLAYAQSGDKYKARQTLERALKLKADFDGADEARKILKSIGG